MKIHGKITYTVDAAHPDIQYIKDWSADKIYTFEDTYIFDEHYGYTFNDDVKLYIKNDLKLVAGGGYDYEHIHNVNFEIEEA